MKQLIIVSYDYPYGFNTKLINDGKTIARSAYEIDSLQEVYDQDKWAYDEYPNITAYAKELNVDQLIVIEDSNIFIKNL